MSETGVALVRTRLEACVPAANDPWLGMPAAARDRLVALAGGKR